MSILLFFYCIEPKKTGNLWLHAARPGVVQDKGRQAGVTERLYRNEVVEAREKSCLFFFNDFFSLQEQGGRYPPFFWFGYFGELDLIGCLQ